jgi:type IV pilus assembly protein PilC
VILVVAVLCFVAAALLVQANNEAEMRFGTLATKIPALGNLGRMMAESHFTTALAALYDAGVLPERAISLAADACGSPTLRRSLLKAVPMVKEGEKMTISLKQTNCLSSYLISMVAIGEEAGTIPQLLFKAHEIQCGEIEQSLHTLKTYITFATNVCGWILGAVVILLAYGVIH